MANQTNVRKIDTVIEYAIIQYREETSPLYEGELIQTMRQLLKEEYILPENSIRDTSTSSTYQKHYINEWRDESGNLMYGQVEGDKTFYAIRKLIQIPKIAEITVEGNSENDQKMEIPFEILSDTDIYLNDTSVGPYLIQPEISYRIEPTGKHISSVDFKINPFNYNPGITIELNPDFTIYKDEFCTEALCSVNITLIIESTYQPSGD